MVFHHKTACQLPTNPTLKARKDFGCLPAGRLVHHFWDIVNNTVTMKLVRMTLVRVTVWWKWQSFMSQGLLKIIAESQSLISWKWHFFTFQVTNDTCTCTNLLSWWNASLQKRLPILGHALYFLWHWPSSPGTSAVYEIYRRYQRDGILAIHVGTEKMTVVGKRQIPLQLVNRPNEPKISYTTIK